MANKTITQLSAVPSVADIDEFEVQVAGEVVTKKCTRKQLTQIEETARAAQDDVIEYAVGLSANGTYPSTDFDNTWYLRTADHQSIVDRSGLVEDLTLNIISALRILDYRLYYSQPYASITAYLDPADILALNSVPFKLITCPDANSAIEVLNITGLYDATGSPVAYEAGANKIEIIYSGTQETPFTISNSFLESSSSIAVKGVPETFNEMVKGADVEITCASNPTLGNGYIRIIATYVIHSLA